MATKKAKKQDDEAELAEVLSTDEYLDLGYTIRKDATGFYVTSPEGEHAHGPTVQDAVLNIGAVVLPDPETQIKALHRRDGTVVSLGFL